MEFVTYVSDDKDGIGQITALIKRIECEKIVCVCASGFELPFEDSRIAKVEVDISKPLQGLRDEMKEKMKKILSNDFEVALSLACGKGKEHMALVSALLNIPVGVRLVAFTKGGIEYLS